MWQKQQPSKSSYRESIKALEADIQHANNLAASLPRDYCGDSVQMKLSYSPLAPFFIYLIELMDYSCTDTLPTFLGLHHILLYKVYVDGMPTMSSQEKKASLREFYAVIYPSLMLLEGNLIESEEGKKRTRSSDILSRNRVDDKRKLLDDDFERDDECGICMEPGTKMVLPTCGHSLCISCFQDWSSRSRSCPFCRGSLKRVDSKDLWVLTNNHEVVDSITIARENLTRFYLYIESLPLATPDAHFFMYDYMI
ncbi:hypothetical protein SOVF_147870 [Spinacia oleracea]|uniref:Peroxisome biogenesis factor 10-like isoform X1 n=1 Tax=Spinacia oleracea TaxID=3562 RepID=A0A9R0IRU3_SPIOL|nr:E3 ubiquitin-protein ligase AIRP2-like isoform X1 [Spinacia oleracea]XP_021854390.1 E3 ubiquitin-protein ligase AIRP2-like isoform X1 [Spinacia oleracea]KNA10058.1 hypothetical protein SOVF_147870 [Spinacia oleracea]